MHGSLFMLGAYFAVSLHELTGSFVLAGAGAVVATVMAGVVLERLARIFHACSQRRAQRGIAARI